MKSKKAAGPHDEHVEVWKLLEKWAMVFLTTLFNTVLESESMCKNVERNVVVLIFKNKDEVKLE